MDSFKLLQLQYKSPNVAVTVLERRACMEPIPIRCIETGEIFGSIRRAEELLDISRQMIADQLKGLIPKANGLTFEKIIAK